MATPSGPVLSTSAPVVSRADDTRHGEPGLAHGVAPRVGRATTCPVAAAATTTYSPPASGGVVLEGKSMTTRSPTDTVPLRSTVMFPRSRDAARQRQSWMHRFHATSP